MFSKKAKSGQQTLSLSFLAPSETSLSGILISYRSNVIVANPHVDGVVAMAPFANTRKGRSPDLELAMAES